MNTLTLTYILVLLFVGSLCEDRQMVTCWRRSKDSVTVNQYGQLRGTTTFDASCSDDVRSRLEIMLENVDKKIKKYWGKQCEKQRKMCSWNVTNISLQPAANYSVQIAPSRCALCSAHSYDLTIGLASNIIETTLPSLNTTIKRSVTSDRSLPLNEVASGVGSAIILAIIILAFVIRRHRGKRCNTNTDILQRLPCDINNVPISMFEPHDIEMIDMSKTTGNMDNKQLQDATEEHRKRSKHNQCGRVEHVPSVIESSDSDEPLLTDRKQNLIFLASFPLPLAKMNDEIENVIKVFKSKHLKISYLEKIDQNRKDSIDEYLQICNDVILIVTDRLIDIWTDKNNVDETAFCDKEMFFMLRQIENLHKTLHIVDFTTTKEHKKKLRQKLQNIGIHTIYDILLRKSDFELLIEQFQKETKD